MPPHDGSCIALNGLYDDHIDELCASDTHLSQTDTNLLELDASWETRTVNIRAIDFGRGRSDEILLSPISGPSYLAKRLVREKTDEKPQRTAYIFEGMNKEVATIIGNHFQMPLSLFVDFQRTTNATSANGVFCSILATGLATQPYLSLPYRSLFTLPKDLTDHFRLGCSDTGRGISIARVNGKSDAVATVNRKCFVWNKVTTNGWACIVICDPPLRNVLIDDKGKIKSYTLPFFKEPAGGRYVNFLPADLGFKTQQDPARTSMADDLCFYLTNHSTLPGLTWDSPDIITLFAKKIVASHYTRHLDQLRRIIVQSQESMRRHSDFRELSLATVEENWSDCQTLEKRLHEYCLDLEEILIQLRVPLERPDFRQITSWKDVLIDFQWLYHQFDHARNWVEKSNYSITALTGIVSNRQACRQQQLSLQAAERTRNITTLGLLFVPLAYVATLFSMSDQYAPGGEKFWLYFVISIPMTLLVLGVYKGVHWVRKRDKEEETSEV